MSDGDQRADYIRPENSWKLASNFFVKAHHQLIHD
jgi:hypothetical protein